MAHQYIKSKIFKRYQSSYLSILNGIVLIISMLFKISYRHMVISNMTNNLSIDLSILRDKTITRVTHISHHIFGYRFCTKNILLLLLVFTWPHIFGLYKQLCICVQIRYRISNQSEIEPENNWKTCTYKY